MFIPDQAGRNRDPAEWRLNAPPGTDEIAGNPARARAKTTRQHPLVVRSWGTVTSDVAIAEIEAKSNTYIVQDSASRHAEVEVVNGPTREYLRTDANSDCADNLDTTFPTADRSTRSPIEGAPRIHA